MDGCAPVYTNAHAYVDTHRPIISAPGRRTPPASCFLDLPRQATLLMVKPAHADAIWPHTCLHTCLHTYLHTCPHTCLYTCPHTGEVCATSCLIPGPGSPQETTGLPGPGSMWTMISAQCQVAVTNRGPLGSRTDVGLRNRLYI